MVFAYLRYFTTKREKVNTFLRTKSALAADNPALLPCFDEILYYMFDSSQAIISSRPSAERGKDLSPSMVLFS